MQGTQLATAVLLLLLVACAVPVRSACAQSLTLMPVLGAHVSGDDFATVSGDAAAARREGRGALAVGADVGIGFLRASVRYAAGGEITTGGIQDREQIGTGSLLAISGNVVLRPLPRLLGLQPYVLGGVGFKRHGFDYEDPAWDDLVPDAETVYAYQLGIGADFMIRRVGLMAEIGDYVNMHSDETGRRHDLFAVIGVRLRLF